MPPLLLPVATLGLSLGFVQLDLLFDFGHGIRNNQVDSTVSLSHNFPGFRTLQDAFFGFLVDELHESSQQDLSTVSRENDLQTDSINVVFQHIIRFSDFLLRLFEHLFDSRMDFVGTFLVYEIHSIHVRMQLGLCQMMPYEHRSDTDGKKCETRGRYHYDLLAQLSFHAPSMKMIGNRTSWR